MNYWLLVAMSASILLPATAAVLRLKKIDGDYLPFFLLLWLGSANEVVKLVVLLNGGRHAMQSNVFGLLRTLLLVWQFRKWNLFGPYPHRFVPTLWGISVFWLLSLVFFPGPEGFNSVFLFGASVFLSVVALNLVSRQIIRNNGPLVKDPVLLVGVAVVFYFSYGAMVEILWWAGLKKNEALPRLQDMETVIRAYVNVITNLMFLFAVLWIPRKRQFILRF